MTNILTCGKNQTYVWQISLVRMMNEDKLILSLVNAVVNKTKKIKPIPHHIHDDKAQMKEEIFENKWWEMYVGTSYILCILFITNLF